MFTYDAISLALSGREAWFQAILVYLDTAVEARFAYLLVPVVLNYTFQCVDNIEPVQIIIIEIAGDLPILPHDIPEFLLHGIVLEAERYLSPGSCAEIQEGRCGKIRDDLCCVVYNYLQF